MRSLVYTAATWQVLKYGVCHLNTAYDLGLGSPLPSWVSWACFAVAFFLWVLAPVSIYNAGARSYTHAPAVKGKFVDGEWENGYSETRRNVLCKERSEGKLWNSPPWVSDVRTLDELFRRSVKRYGDAPALGTRAIVGRQAGVISFIKEGEKVEKKTMLPVKEEYKYSSFTEVARNVEWVGKGLASLRLKPRDDRVAIYANTRPEWQITAQGCFQQNFPVVTVYATLGHDAIKYSLRQTQVPVVVTEAKLLPELLLAAEELTHLRFVVYFDELTDKKMEKLAEKVNVQLVSYAELMDLGKKSRQSEIPQPPQADDWAVIMYTSGSTGDPKGVLIKHRNLVACCAAVCGAFPSELNPSDRYLGYLPLAHVLELAAEITMLSHGVSIGYSDPKSLGGDTAYAAPAEGKEATVKRGDLVACAPTVLAAVPLVLDRLRSKVEAKVASKSFIARSIFKLCYYMKERAYLRGHSTWLWDKIVFNKVAGVATGGRLRYLVSGGAPLSKATQRFMTIVFNTPVLQGYGLTETCGAGAVHWGLDRNVGHVGPPLPSLELKLEDVPELDYYTTIDGDTPEGGRLGGEILFHGGPVTAGYYKLPDKTADTFEEMKDGQIWFHSGDIGRWNPDGSLSIIDRKKDLVKLAHGEYLALGALEAKFRGATLVGNICIVANSELNYAGALIDVDRDELRKWCAEPNAPVSDATKAIESTALEVAVLNQLKAIAKEQKMARYEVPRHIHVCRTAWSPENNLLTASLKMRRKQVVDYFEKDVKALLRKVAGK